MALVYTQDAPYTGPRHGNNKLSWDGTITLDTDCPSDGWLLDKTKFGFSQVLETFVCQSFHSKYWFDFKQTSLGNGVLQPFERKLRTGDTAAGGGAETGCKLVDNAASPAESAVRLDNTLASTSYDVVHAISAAAGDDGLTDIVIRVHAEGR